MAPLSPLLRPFGGKLWTPGQVKADGIPRIDWTHPLTNRLVSYWWGLDAGYIDLVTVDSTSAGTGGTRTVLPVPTASPQGSGPTFNLGTQLCKSGRLAGIQSWTAPYSFACGWVQKASPVFNSQAGWWGIADGTGNDAFMVFCPSSGNLGVSYGNTGSAFTFAVTANTFYVLVGAATGTTAQSTWINGLPQTAGTATSAFSGSAMQYVFGSSVLNSTNTVDNVNSLIFFGATWSGLALTQADAALLYTDPYCFLVPTEPETMIVQTTAAPDVLGAQTWM